MPATRPLLVAHRGASGYRPEHSRSAYELAIDMGCDAVEPDVVATRDGVLVVRHAERDLRHDRRGKPSGVRRPPYDEVVPRSHDDGLVHRGLHLGRAADPATARTDPDAAAGERAVRRVRAHAPAERRARDRRRRCTPHRPRDRHRRRDQARRVLPLDRLRPGCAGCDRTERIRMAGAGASGHDRVLRTVGPRADARTGDRGAVRLPARGDGLTGRHDDRTRRGRAHLRRDRRAWPGSIAGWPGSTASASPSR